MSALAMRYLDAFFPGSTDVLRIGGLSADELSREFGTPLYVFDAGILRSRAERVRLALGPLVEVLFALKANPSAAVCQVLAQAGLGVDVASGGEVRVAQRAGFKGSQAHFAGPGKLDHDFAEARGFGLGTISLESEAEYERLARYCRRHDWRAGVAVRVNSAEGTGSRLRMTGRGRKFGVPREHVEPLVERIVADGVVEFLGIHWYLGTQCFDATAWVRSAARLLELADQIEARTQAPVRQLNFGGGFGVPLFDGDGEFELERCGTELQGLLRIDARPDRRYCVELGRYLSAPAGVYLSRVSYAKGTADAMYLLVDGGVHHHSAAAGAGAFSGRSYPLVRTRMPTDPPYANYGVGGPLCTPLDEFAEGTWLPRVLPGDLLAVLASGAYGLTFSNQAFLSHPSPAEVMVDAGKAHLVRQRGAMVDALRGQYLPGETTC